MTSTLAFLTTILAKIEFPRLSILIVQAPGSLFSNPSTQTQNHLKSLGVIKADFRGHKQDVPSTNVNTYISIQKVRPACLANKISVKFEVILGNHLMLNILDEYE